jgi:spore coat polysaccharide biosynthesis protein SpsF
MLAIVQARMTSKRLPGKVLMPLGGRPMLSWTVGRLRSARSVTHVLVATSNEGSDDPVAEYCTSAGIAFHRGPLENVALRFAEAALIADAPAFLRISGDSPVLDPAIVDCVIEAFSDHDCDLATNVQRRTFPKGQSVEVLRTTTFVEACEAMTDAADREHVTKVFYANPDQYRIVNVDSGKKAGRVQLSVDTSDDFRKMEALIAACEGAPRGWHELWELQSSTCPEAESAC